MQVRAKRKRREVDASSSRPKRQGRPPTQAIAQRCSRNEAFQQIRKRLLVQPKKNNVRPNRNLSPFENLPSELLQQIFFHSFEVNLPRASPYLASQLANDSTFRVLILFAYFDDDSPGPVETHHFLPAQYRKLDVQVKVRLQEGILNCRWCTLDRVKSCMPILSRLAMTKAWYRERAADAESEADLEVKGRTPFECHTGATRLPRLDDVRGMERHYAARAKSWVWTSFPHGSIAENVGHTMPDGSPACRPGGLFVKRDDFLPWIVGWRLVPGPGSPHKVKQNGHSVLAARHLPDRLVRGNPWTDEKLEFLQLLRLGHKFLEVDLFMSISAEAVVEGMASAVVEHHLLALTTLLELHSSLFHDPAWSPNDAARRAAWYVRRSHHPLPLKLFHLAVKQDGAQDLVALLLRHGADAIVKDDTTLTAWALRAKKQGIQVAEWLLRYMEATDDSTCPSASMPRNDHTYQEGSPFSTTDFDLELGYPGGYRTPPRNLDGGPCG